jgi:hypothetical protein
MRGTPSLTSCSSEGSSLRSKGTSADSAVSASKSTACASACPEPPHTCALLAYSQLTTEPGSFSGRVQAIAGISTSIQEQGSKTSPSAAPKSPHKGNERRCTLDFDGKQGGIHCTGSHIITCGGRLDRWQACLRPPAGDPPEVRYMPRFHFSPRLACREIKLTSCQHV